MFTANTMSSTFEAMGISLPYSSTMAAEDIEKSDSAARSAEVLVQAIRKQILPSHILTKKAFENAISVVMAVGGTTNAVLHLLAIAHAMNVDLNIDDFETIRKRVPVFVDMKPSGRYVVTNLHKAGGIPQVMKMLLVHGLLHGDCITITGETITEVLKDVPSEPRLDQDVIRAWSNPIYKQGHLAILKGNLAPEGSVAKISGIKNPSITGSARVFDCGGKCQPDVHAGRVFFDGTVDEVADFREGFDGRQVALHFGAGDAHDFAVNEDVFAPGEFRIEACAEFEERRNASAGNDASGGGLKDAADDLQQRALSAAIGADEADDFAAIDAERNIPQRPEVLVEGGAAEGVEFANPVKRSLVESIAFGDVLNQQQAFSVSARCNGLQSRMTRVRSLPGLVVPTPVTSRVSVSPNRRGGRPKPATLPETVAPGSNCTVA